MQKMLTFNPDKRITVKECLSHPYFEDLHDPEDDCSSEEIFNWEWDSFKLTKKKL